MDAVKTIRETFESGRPFLLDGGLGGELETRGFDISSALWSAELIFEQPEALLAVHRDFLEAGAQCISTASYQASEAGLKARGLSAVEIEAVFRASVELACRARDDFMRDNPELGYRPLVAASVGPYGAYLADGSEYRGNYGVSEKQLRDFHAQRLRWLDNTAADLIACETIPDLQEARVLSRLLASVVTPAWVSFCCRDSQRLHDGNRLRAACELFDGHPRVFAIGVNCCPSKLVEGMIKNIAAVEREQMIVVYPNSGQQYDAASKHWSGASELSEWSRQARQWFEAGAGIIGGCCHIGPAFISELASIESWHC
ncbi:MAG: homocysteine S-methyltransferase [Gammaproteobacteria bacterium]|nr:homocysteine S-methyltransferase [Gammaproteobacteria bacterium]